MNPYERMAMIQQQQQMSQSQGRPQPPQGQMPPQSAPMPPEQYPNPIGAGTQAAIEAARQSISLNEPQRQQGWGTFIKHMGHAMGQVGRPGEPTQGLGRVISRMNAGMMPAMEAHDMEDARARHENFILVKQHHEMQRQARKEEFMREKFEAENAYNRRYLNIMEGKIGKSKKEQNQPNNSGMLETKYGTLDLSAYRPMRTAAEKTKASNGLKQITRAYNELKSIEKNFNALKNDTKSNKFQPTGSMMPGINAFKDAAGRTFNKNDLNKERVSRDLLAGQFKELEPLMEGAQKGAPAGEQTLKAFREAKVYPSVDLPMDLNEAKIKYLVEKVGKQKAALELTNETGLTVYDFPDELQLPDEEQHQEEERREPQNSNAKFKSLTDIYEEFPEFDGLPPEKVKVWAARKGYL